MAQERQVNTFLRLGSPSVQAGLRRAIPGLPPDALSPETVFVKLRELHNRW